MHGDAVGGRQGDGVGDLDPRRVEVAGEVGDTALRATWARSMSARMREAWAARWRGELDESLDHAQEAVGAGLDPVDQLAASLVVVGVADGVDEALDGGHRGAEVVVEGGVERVLRVLERLEVGAVAGDLGVAGEVALARRGGR